ncbi:MAG: hypothetical protein ABIA04_04935 [Pseudomonadota bacterium]
MKPINSNESAIRLARAIASDILLYNEDEVILGLTNDDLFHRLKDKIREGEQLYNSRVSNEIKKNYNFYDRAIVDVIVNDKGKEIDSAIW